MYKQMFPITKEELLKLQGKYRLLRDLNQHGKFVLEEHDFKHGNPEFKTYVSALTEMNAPLNSKMCDSMYKFILDSILQESNTGLQDVFIIQHNITLQPLEKEDGYIMYCRGALAALNQ